MDLLKLAAETVRQILHPWWKPGFWSCFYFCLQLLAAHTVRQGKCAQSSQPGWNCSTVLLQGLQNLKAWMEGLPAHVTRAYQRQGRNVTRTAVITGLRRLLAPADPFFAGVSSGRWHRFSAAQLKSETTYTRHNRPYQSPPCSSAAPSGHLLVNCATCAPCHCVFAWFVEIWWKYIVWWTFSLQAVKLKEHQKLLPEAAVLQHHKFLDPKFWLEFHKWRKRFLSFNQLFMFEHSCWR